MLTHIQLRQVLYKKKKKNFWLHTFLENLSLNDSFSYCFCSLKKEEEKRILILYYLSVTGYESDMLYNSQGRLFSNEQMKKKAISNSEWNSHDISGQMNIFRDIFQSNKILSRSRDFNYYSHVLEFQESWWFIWIKKSFFHLNMHYDILVAHLPDIARFLLMILLTSSPNSYLGSAYFQWGKISKNSLTGTSPPAENQKSSGRFAGKESICKIKSMWLTFMCY